MKKTIITALILCSIGYAKAQSQDTSKKINQVYYSDISKSLQTLQAIYNKIHGKTVSDHISSSTRDSLDALMNVVLQPIFSKVPQGKEPAKTGKP